MTVSDLINYLGVQRGDLEVLVQVDERLDAGTDLLRIAHCTINTWYEHPDKRSPDTVRHDQVVLVAQSVW